MGIIDDLFGARGAQPANAAPASPSPAPTYGDFYKRLLSAANANIDAQRPLSQRGLFNLLTGNDRAATVANTEAGAPTAWQQFQQAQSGMQNAQLGTARDIATTGAMTGTQIDPSNIPASIPAMTNAYGGMLNGTPSAQTGGSAAPANDLQAQRANFLRMGKFFQLSGKPEVANDYFKAANAGVPQDTAVLPSGAVGDGITGRPITADVGTLLAGRAGQVAAADSAPRVAGQIKVAGNQAGLDRQTSAIENADKARYDQVTGYSNVNGQPMTISKAAAANNAVPGFVAGDNPYLPKHQAEVEGAQKDASEAANTVIQLKTLDAALKGIHTGQWGEDIQSIRRGLSSIGLSDPALQAATTKGDIAGQIGLEVAALRARAASGGRTALGTLNAFRSVKPGLLSTDPRAQIQSLIPAYQRQIDYANFVNGYYGTGKNWNKLDAPTAFQQANPDRKYVDAAGLNGAPPPDPATYGAPDGAKFVGWHAGKPVFDVNGKKFLGN